jgi:hypothetical protein
MISNGGPIEWVRYLNKIGTKEEKKQRLGILFSFWWRIWKERTKGFLRALNNLYLGLLVAGALYKAGFDVLYKSS